MGKCNKVRRKRKSNRVEDKLFSKRKSTMPPFKDEHVLVSEKLGWKATPDTQAMTDFPS